MKRNARLATPVIDFPRARLGPSSASHRCQLVISRKNVRSPVGGGPIRSPLYGSTSMAPAPSKATVAGAAGSPRKVSVVGAASGRARRTRASSVSGERRSAEAEGGADQAWRSAHSSICFS
jgi:hypothetical protein